MRELPYFLVVLIGVFLSADFGLGNAQDSTQQEIFREMIDSSVKGEWYPLSNKSLPYEGFKVMKERI